MTAATTLAPAPAAAPAVPSRRPGRAVWPGRLLRLGSVLAAILLWQVLTTADIRLWLRFDTLPSVTEVLTAFGRQLGTDVYYLDLAQSLIRILTGFGIATVLGVASGIALGRSRLFAGILGPLTELARPVPAIAVVPIAILLFPDDEAGIVFITGLAAYFPIMVSVPVTRSARCRPCGRTRCARSAAPGGMCCCGWCSPVRCPGSSVDCRSGSGSPGSAWYPRR